MPTVQVECAGQIPVTRGEFPKELYPHQNLAIKKLDIAYQKPTEGLLVLPTGGGKTLTSVYWLLRSFIDQHKKVLWIAHRHELLNQAFETIKLSAYSSILKNRSSFRYRIISGHPNHDRPVNIQANDDIIIASKDSLNSGISHLLEKWVKHQDEILIVVDEAHHATAKTYRKVINAVKDSLIQRQYGQGFKMLGLTATPFRTSETEKGLLSKVFRDDIIFAEHLRNMIFQGILAEPIFESLATKVPIYKDLTPKDIKTIENLDNIPPDIAEKLAKSAARNRLIVDHYLNNLEKYKPLLVFAIDVDHAIALNALFNNRGKEKGIKSEFVVAQIRDAKTGATISVKDNTDKIERFRKGEFDVLINVEMLTEGTDLPNVQTVFLTRPTTSTIQMTQMIGRALRGTQAGGTEKAYVVSFIDEWENKINWINPEKLHVEESSEFIDRDIQTIKQTARLISIEKMEEFARIMDESIDTSYEEGLEFLKRIPLGIYRFTISELAENPDDEAMPRNYEVLVYDDSAEAYDNFVNDLGVLFKALDSDIGEYLEDTQLEYLLDIAKPIFFPDSRRLIGFRDQDVKNIIRYYAQKEIKPEFLPFTERKKCDLGAVAQYVYDNELSTKAIATYLDSIWNSESTYWQVLFGYSIDFFWRQYEIEIKKLARPNPNLKPAQPKPVIPDDVNIETLTLDQIREFDSKYYTELKDKVFQKQTDAWDFITCAASNFKSHSRNDFQIDHIVPMSDGGLSADDNLQVLSRKAHTAKTRVENINRQGRKSGLLK